MREDIWLFKNLLCVLPADFSFGDNTVRSKCCQQKVQSVHRSVQISLFLIKSKSSCVFSQLPLTLTFLALALQMSCNYLPRTGNKHDGWAWLTHSKLQRTNVTKDECLALFSVIWLDSWIVSLLQVRRGIISEYLYSYRSWPEFWEQPAGSMPLKFYLELSGTFKLFVALPQSGTIISISVCWLFLIFFPL